MKYRVDLFFALFLSLSLLNTSESTLWSFGQEGQGQGQVRCINGQLVNSPTECPSTDICPSPSGPNTVVSCSPREPTKPSTSQTKRNESEAVIISTSKPAYKFGE